MDERASSTPNEDCWHSTYGKCDQALFPMGMRLPALWTHKRAPRYTESCCTLHMRKKEGGADYYTVLEQDLCLVG